MFKNILCYLICISWFKCFGLEAVYLRECLANLQWNLVPLRHWELSASDTKSRCQSPESSDTRQRKSDVSIVAVTIKVVSEKMSDGIYVVLIIVQRDGTQSSLFIILQVYSTCFGCQPHPSKLQLQSPILVILFVELLPSNVAKLGHVGGR